MSPDPVASIQARLLNKAKAAEVEYQLYLVRYACERFLYRLGESAHRERCVLKGAGLLSLWLPDPYRMTRDLDFLATGASDSDSIAQLVRDVCAVACPQDGLDFDADSLVPSPIRAEEEYAGQRVKMTAHLGRSRIRFQADFGFGDAVVPPPERSEYPVLLPSLPPPRIRVYRREVSIAEKFEAMVKLGRRNSRMKDFHDVWALASAFAFEGPLLREAVVACFERRGTAWVNEPPDVLRSAFYGDDELSRRWTDYFGSGAFLTPPPANFQIIGERILAFLVPLRDRVIAAEPFGLSWQPGGPWR